MLNEKRSFAKLCATRLVTVVPRKDVKTDVKGRFAKSEFDGGM